MIPNNFREWACSLSGCDGGNKSAETWLCGIEWGGGSYDSGIYYKENLPNEISKGSFTPSDTLFDWKDSVTYPYGRSFAKLYAAIQGEDINNYKELAENKWVGSELFKLNLYPIAFDSTDESLWHEYKLDEITGFDEKHLFQTWCFMNRFPAFAKLRQENNPKLIICTGVSYLRDFFMCFGGGQEESGLIEYDEIEVLSESNKKIKRRYYWVKLSKRTTLVVIPFFSGSSGLNSNQLLQDMGGIIRNLIDK
jgi:hypothetical protein